MSTNVSHFTSQVRASGKRLGSSGFSGRSHPPGLRSRPDRYTHPLGKRFAGFESRENEMKFGVGILGATGYIATPYRREIRECITEAAIVALCARRREQHEAAGREDDAQMITDDW